MFNKFWEFDSIENYVISLCFFLASFSHDFWFIPLQSHNPLISNFARQLLVVVWFKDGLSCFFLIFSCCFRMKLIHFYHLRSSIDKRHWCFWFIRMFFLFDIIAVRIFDTAPIFVCFIWRSCALAPMFRGFFWRFWPEYIVNAVWLMCNTSHNFWFLRFLIIDRAISSNPLGTNWCILEILLTRL